MVDISAIGKGERVPNRTPKEFLDLSRPYYMADADTVFSLVQASFSNSAADAYNIASKLSARIQMTKGRELDNLWLGVEKSVNRGNTLKHKGTKTGQELQTAVGLFYSALNHIDETGESSAPLNNFRDAYLDAAHYVENKFLGQLSGVEKRMVERALQTIDKRLDAVIERFNLKIEEGEIAGPKIAL